MYRNIVYNKQSKSICLLTWDKDGNRVNVNASYEPYLYIETREKTSNISLFDTYLKKKSFTSPSHRYRFIKELATDRIFENIRWDQQFLIDVFMHENEKPEFTKQPLKTWFLDIETYSPGEFPVPDKAADSINVITVFDSLTKSFTTWGTKKLKTPIKNCKYIFCPTEFELLQKFLATIHAESPDVLSGWNSEFFDIPYIVNRVAKILGEKSCHLLSPVGTVYPRNIRTQFGREAVRWFIDGISCIDYLDVYKKFSVGLRESYKLDAIASRELGERKVEYGNINLATLADEDWQTFVEYNIQDVNLLVRMEHKLRYMELLRMLAYTGLTTFESAMGTLPVITGASVIASRKKGKILPTFTKNGSDGQYEGAYVGEPQKGFQRDIISFDANSLYPNTMITLNLSPETKVGKIIDSNSDEVIVRLETGKVHKFTPDKFYEYVKVEQLAITRAKVLFSQKQKGIIPEIVDKIYKSRVDIKKELKVLKLKLSKMKKSDPDYTDTDTEMTRLDIKQFTLKILINTVYGYFGNKYAPIGDADIARSITLTGQAVIKQSNIILQEYIKDNSSGDYKDKNPIIYNDTDSSYISIESLLKSKDIPFSENGIITKEAILEADKIEDYLNREIYKWATSSLNSIDPRFVFKREAMSDSGIFLAKKRYVLHMLDDEGIPCSKFKYTGVEVVRTTMPNSIKPHVKSIIETMLMTRSLSQTNEKFQIVYDQFKSLPVEDYAFVMGVKDYNKYADKCTHFNTVKGMPIHVKSAYIHNLLLDEYNIDKTYERISSGDKIRYFYLKTPNKFGVKSLAYKHYLPPEFLEDFSPDIELMFDKIVYNVIERFYEGVGWNLRKPGQQLQTDLFDLLAI